MTQKANQNPWTMDVRVRERNLKSGALTEKDLEKYLSTLTDLAEQVEPFATPQPALAQPPAPPPPPPPPTDGVEEHVALAEPPMAEPPSAPAPMPTPPPAPAPAVVEAAPPEVAPANVVVNGEGEPT